jgi:anaerobic dimethyl sulfoxide reductase subunit B (iron-sulfur subunit)
MQKCQFCLERLQQGQQAICIEACPMFALDMGPIDQLRAKYGDATETEGFKTNNRYKPSAVFKPKQR